MPSNEKTGASQPDDLYKGALILLLAATAGFVDAVGFLNLGHLFTTHMSGNSAATGAYLGQGNWSEMGRRAYPVPIFVLGVAVGALMTEGAIVRRARSVFWMPLALEAVLLMVYIFAGDHQRPVLQVSRQLALATLPAFAMGLQNASLRRVGHSSVRTTYVTGMLTDFAEQIVSYLFWRIEHARGAHSADHAIIPKPESLMLSFLYGGIWLMFVAGAGLGSLMNTYWSFNSLAIPVAGVLTIVAVDLVRPLYTPAS